MILWGGGGGGGGGAGGQTLIDSLDFNAFFLIEEDVSDTFEDSAN